MSEINEVASGSVTSGSATSGSVLRGLAEVDDREVVMRVTIERPSDAFSAEMIETDDELILAEWNEGVFELRCVDADDGIGVAKITSRLREILAQQVL